MVDNESYANLHDELVSENKKMKKLLKDIWMKYDCLVDWSATEKDLKDRKELEPRILEVL